MCAWPCSQPPVHRHHLPFTTGRHHYTAAPPCLAIVVSPQLTCCSRSSSLFTLLQPTGSDSHLCACCIAFVSVPKPTITTTSTSTIPTTYAIPSVSLPLAIPYPTGIALTLDHLNFLSRYNAHVFKQVYLQSQKYHPSYPLFLLLTYTMTMFPNS